MLNTTPTLAELRQRREAIIALAARYMAEDVRVFGSVARGDAHANSDVDLLVRFRAGASLFEQSALWQELEALLGRSVNLVSEGGLRPGFRRRIENDLVTL